MKRYLENAFRILGLPVTATNKDIIKRVDDIKTYIEIGKTITYATDFEWIGELNRSKDSINKALQDLQNPEKRLWQTVFWFWPENEIDEMAFDLLKSGKINQTIEIWEIAVEQNISACSYVKNLAILYHILALRKLKCEISDADKFLRSSILHWGTIIHSKYFKKKLNVIGWNYSFQHLIDKKEIKSFWAKEIHNSYKKFFNKSSANLIGNYIVNFRDSNFPENVKSEIQDSLIETLIDRVKKLCDSAMKERIDSPGDSLEIGEKLKENSEKDLEIINSLLSEYDNSRILINDKVAEELLNCSIFYGNETKNWGKAKELCDKASLMTIGKLLKERIQENLKIITENANYEKVFGDLKQIKKAPYLLDSIIGLMLYWKKNYDSNTDSYETTRYFTFFGIPLFPIDRYRVIGSSDGGYSFLGKLTLQSSNYWHIFIFISIVIFFYICGNFQNGNNTTRSYSPNYSEEVFNQPNNDIFYEKPPDNSFLKNDKIEKLANELDNNKKLIETYEIELTNLNSTLELSKNSIKKLNIDILVDESTMELGGNINEVAYKNKINNYNKIVNQHNSNLKKHDEVFAKYEKVLQKYNEKVTEYNNLIRK